MRSMTFETNSAPSTTLRVVPLPRSANASRGRVKAGAARYPPLRSVSGAGEGDRAVEGWAATLLGNDHPSQNHPTSLRQSLLACASLSKICGATPRFFSESPSFIRRKPLVV